MKEIKKMVKDQKTIIMLKRKSKVLVKILRIINGKRMGMCNDNIQHLYQEQKEINTILKPL